MATRQVIPRIRSNGRSRPRPRPKLPPQPMLLQRQPESRAPAPPQHCECVNGPLAMGDHYTAVPGWLADTVDVRCLRCGKAC